MRRAKGFSLIELLILLAILGILLGIGAVRLQQYRYQTELREAQQIIVRELTKARSDARRLSQNQRVTWDTDNDTVNQMPVSTNGQVKLKKVTTRGRGTRTDFLYTAPHARTNLSNRYLEFQLVGRGGVTGTVNVMGVTGRVYTQ